ncbi:U11/U12 small nuclear ribonucleoprotein [Wolffia australiana]
MAAISDASSSTIDLVALHDLAAQAETTIDSIRAFLSPSGRDLFSEDGFCCCPFDSRHRMPPESLFSHSLRCNSAPGGPIRELGFLGSTRYPNTVQPEEEIGFVRPLPESGPDLCFSLEDFGDIVGSNFFFKDCPGVYTFPKPEVSARTFSLPKVLALECANFISVDRGIEGSVSQTGSRRILPSEFWGFKQEIEAWKEFPKRYSYLAVRVISCLAEAGDFGFRKWVLSVSPRFGIVIDPAMSDHICLILNLCLRAIWREALVFFKNLSMGHEIIDPRSLNFKCPCLSEVLTWLASQLSILYGEINGKNMAISMIIECLKRFGLSFLLLPLEEERYSEENAHECKFDAVLGERADDLTKLLSGKIFVSQVAAAVAALHERAMIEDRLNQQRFPRTLSKDQLLHELSIVSTRAQEERAKRPNYKPILEFDGLFWKKSLDQDKTRTKTREELLAEERDYKRRRMSYRGKKVKRTTVQVIRDIIEEHMQEISEGGGIGCNVSESAASAISSSITIHQGNSSTEYPTSKTHVLDFDAVSATSNDHVREMKMDMDERIYHQHESSARYRDQGRSHDRRSYSHQRKQDEDRGYSSNSRSYKDYSDSYLSTGEMHSMSERRRNNRKRDYKIHKSESVSETTFEDRYDPSDASG